MANGNLTSSKVWRDRLCGLFGLRLCTVSRDLLQEEIGNRELNCIKLVKLSVELLTQGHVTLLNSMRSIFSVN